MATDHDRIVLLFDLDCFYAQCERVRLGFGQDAKLALLQWNSALAVTYPARIHGIVRGDSWDAVKLKSNGTCHAIHLRIIEAKTTANKEEDREEQDEPVVDNIQEAFDKIYKLSPEQLSEARKELGIQRFYHEGKACLERYRLASMRIFTVVLESLTKHLDGKDKFVLERASIDEFYLDITKYCYDNHKQEQAAESPSVATPAAVVDPKTVVVGDASIHVSNNSNNNGGTDDCRRTAALHKACQVSHWIRSDVERILGFTMSAGISTNKMMAKLAASFGKPNGQAVLHPDNFETLLQTTKIKKVRHFGGKLGREVIQTVLNGNKEATMGDLAQVPFPLLQRHLPSSAHFVYSACRGIDREAVKETEGALVKSITAFKSFTATSDVQEIKKWLDILVGEIVSRVAKDTFRNKRYPKLCTLNYTYYTTPSGKRPQDGTHRSQRNTRSVRLDYPQEKHPNKIQMIKQQAMDRLLPVLAKHPLRGVGLSTNNFETRGQPPAGVLPIDNFFSTAKKNNSTATTATAMEPTQKVGLKSIPQPTSLTTTMKEKDRHQPIPACPRASACPSETENDLDLARKLQASINNEQPPQDQNSGDSTDIRDINRTHCSATTTTTEVVEDKDMELAKKLQARFDRENYVLTAVNRRSNGGPPKKKARRIDAFFKRS
eukprot:scaffold4157_cov136-Cylindrotheca_fusiformis.AAC.4